jgi:hypothetical protein
MLIYSLKRTLSKGPRLHFPFNLHNDGLLRLRNSSMQQCIPLLPQLIHKCSKTKLAKVEFQSFSMQNNNTPFRYTFPINRRIRKRALSHNSLPYTSTKAALEENMISALLESMTKQAVGASSITPAAHYLLGYNGVTKDQPEEERVPRYREGKPYNFPPFYNMPFHPQFLPSCCT